MDDFYILETKLLIFHLCGKSVTYKAYWSLLQLPSPGWCIGHSCLEWVCIGREELLVRNVNDKEELDFKIGGKWALSAINKKQQKASFLGSGEKGQEMKDILLIRRTAHQGHQDEPKCQ